MPSPSLQPSSIVWPGQRYRTTHYSRISSQGESLVLALAQRLCPANSKQKPLASTFYTLLWIGSTCIGAVHIDLSHHTKNGIHIMVVPLWPFHYKESRKTVLCGVVSLGRKIIVMVGSFSCLVLFLLWFILPFISSDKPGRTRVEQREMWRHIGETRGLGGGAGTTTGRDGTGRWRDGMGQLPKHFFLNPESITNVVEHRS